jgi:hypothetical protein
MKLTRQQLRRLIRESMEDPRARLDLSRLPPDDREKLETIKASGDMALYYMFLDSILESEGDTYLDTIGYAAQILEQPPVSVKKDMFMELISQEGYAQKLYDVIDRDIEATVARNDSLNIKGVPDLTHYDIAGMLDILDELNPSKYQAHLNQRALLHMIISLANSTSMFFIFAEEEGIIHYIDKNTYALSSYFRSLYEAGKINVTGLERNNKRIDPSIKA